MEMTAGQMVGKLTYIYRWLVSILGDIVRYAVILVNQSANIGINKYGGQKSNLIVEVQTEEQMEAQCSWYLSQTLVNIWVFG